MEVRYPPPLKRGISAILARYPMKTRQMGANNTPLRYYLERVLRDMGGISHWAAKLRCTVGLPSRSALSIDSRRGFVSVDSVDKSTV